LRLVLLGRKDSGKSSARNTILGIDEKIQAAATAATSTSTQQSESTQGEVAGRKVIVVETPDWFSPGLSPEKVREDVNLCVQMSSPGPHAFLLVIPVRHYTNKDNIEDELKVILPKMEEMFGEGCYRNIIILFTITDEHQRKNTEILIQSENEEVQTPLEKCGNRFFCLNIRESGGGSQVSELFEKIEMVNGKMLSEDIKQLEDVKKELLKKEEELSVNKEGIITTELQLVLVGKSGSDKTEAKNIIQGIEEVNLATTSTATDTEQSQSTHASAGRKVIMVDNLDGSTPEIQEVKQSVGPQAFLLVIPVKNSEDEVHNVDETQVSPDTMEEIFGKKFWSSTMILFTVSDKLQERQIEEFIQSGDLRTRRLVEKCGNRFHCLNIKDSGGSQVSELLEKIEKMLNRN
ncbi:GTPase IMAP family member 8 isoform X4, partial [Silurus asotus]